MRHRTRRSTGQVYMFVFLGLLALGWPAALPVPNTARLVVFWINAAVALGLVARFSKAIRRWTR